uniref:ribonucleoside-diphosphate reductase n=1 Tax=viral metagenome TaxID=1070528 RepID=A0A6C0KWM7_9ZZZZ
MRVLKRDNTYEDVSLYKVQKRIDSLCQGLNVAAIEIAQKVCSRIHDGVKTSTLDDEAARLCAQLITKHPDYGIVAARIAISNHQKKTSPSFSETINLLYNVTDVHGKHNPLVSDEVWNIVQTHKDKLNSIINYERDYNYDYFGFKTLERSYLLKVNGKFVERPQHMIMRVALGIHGWDLKEAIETYELMSTRYFTHATPTLFNAGTPRSQLASCFLIAMEDSITGMYKTLADCAQISKYAGGIGVHIHDIRATDSYIRGTNGQSTGIVPMLRVYNDAGRHVNQCFKGDTIVYTNNGPKHMENVVINDEIITIDGTFKPVLGISVNNINENILKISCKWTKSTGVYVTKQHQIYTIDDNDNIIEKSAEDLRCYDYVGFPFVYGDTSNVKIIYSSEHKCTIYWVKISSIEEVKYEGKVYDFNMKDNHNYLTDMGIVHNSGKRNGSIAVYLEPWHADIEKFLDLRKNSGNHEERCHDLFTAMWIPDLFMKRVDANADWSLMCPDECQGLTTAYGDDFEKLYEKYETEGKYRKKVKAQTLFYSIMRSQIETGTPYMLYKDAVNKKSNQSNLGTIKSSNLCVASETMIITDNGYKNIKEVSEVNNGITKVWNGTEFSEVTVIKTGEMQKLLTVNFSNGLSIRCTPYHKFHIVDTSDSLSKVKVIDAKDLKIDDTIIDYKIPKINSKEYDFYTNIKIKSVEDNNEYDDTYCFNEPLRHTGIFNGIITGNCTEITLYSDKDETAVCNLASIGLPTFVKYSDDSVPYFDFKELHRVTQVITRNLNKVIDRTFYPIPETRTSNLRHRPLGIGVQGLANTYVLMRMPFESPDASTLNRKIFATIYHAALTASVAISRRRYEYREELNNSTVVATNERKEYLIKYLNMIPEEEALKGQYSGAYSSFIGSPASQGKLQYDLWDVKEPETVDGFLDWVSLKEEIAQYGLRNSTLLAPMPTATTSQILGFNESFEAFTSNIYQRQTLAGEFTIINKHLIQDLLNLGMWNNEMKDKILSGSGSVQNIKDIPENVRLLYKTVWEIKQKIVIDQSADRAPYICQTQSLNIHLEDPDFAKMTNVHFYGWKKGLKTGMYYLRSRNKAKITAFTLENNKYALGGTSAASSSNINTMISSVSGVSGQPSEEEVLACRRDNPEGCVMCSG